MNRVNVNELEEEYSPAGTLLLTWGGKLFTGVAYEISPQGKLWSEQSYEEGILSGVSKDWYPNGQIRAQTDFAWSRVHGHDREWYENGQIKRYAVCELGIVLQKKEWDEHGVLVKEYTIETDPWATKLLATERKLFKREGISYQLVI